MKNKVLKLSLEFVPLNFLTVRMFSNLAKLSVLVLEFRVLNDDLKKLFSHSLFSTVSCFSQVLYINSGAGICLTE